MEWIGLALCVAWFLVGFAWGKKKGRQENDAVDSVIWENDDA